MEALLERIAGLPPAGIYAVIFALVAVENILPPVPSDFAVALGAFLAARGAVNPWIIYAGSVVANVGGALAVFEASKHYGKKFLKSRLGRRLVSEKAQERIEKLYRKYHLWGILVSRLLPVYRTIVPPFAAAIGLPASKALPPVAVATAIYYAVLMSVSYALGKNLDAVERLVGHIGIGLLIAAVLVTLAIILLVWKKKHPEHG